MVEKSLIFIKHHFTFLWRLIERANSFIFLLLYSTTLEKVLSSVFSETTLPQYTFRKLGLKDLNLLYDLIHEQRPADIEYFHPHGFDLKSIRKQFSNSSFLMMGVFFRQKLVGYFFLRFFANKKCFVGRLIDQHYRGKGIGRVMNNIMYETSWRMGFRCLSTISRQNTAVMRAHANNPNILVLKELQNNYLLVEFVRDAKPKSSVERMKHEFD